MWPALGIEMGTRDRTPAALFAGLAHTLQVAGRKLVNRLLERRCDVAERMHADLQLIGRVSSPSSGLTVEVHQRPKPARISTDDRDHQRQPQRARTRERARRSTDPQPDWQRVLHRPRINTLAGQGRPEFTGPGDVLVVADRQQEVQFLGEQRVVVFQVVAKERKRLDRRAAADDHLGAPLGQQVERRELLEEAHRVRCAQHGHCAGQADTSGSCCRGGQDDARGRVEEVAAVVLADAKDVQADLVSALNALEQLAQSNFRAGGEAGVVERSGETIDSDLHLSIQTYLLNQASSFDIVNRSRAAPIPLTTSKVVT